MAGQNGQEQRTVREGTVREQAWQNMRYFGAAGFTGNDLVMTVPGATRWNMWKWLRSLDRHGVIRCIAPEDRPRRVSRRYMVARESRLHPVVCARCEKPISARECVSASAEEER